MVAIAGILCARKLPSRDVELTAMVDSMASRASGGFIRQVVAGVHVAQGMARNGSSARSTAGTSLCTEAHCTVVFDGRLDDYSSLANQLDFPLDSRADRQDAALVLRAYLRWGIKAPEKLVGDFAFAIIDERLGRLLLARDHLGNRPLHYVSRDGLFAFATEDEALLCCDDVVGTPNLQLVATLAYPSYGHVLDTNSWFDDIVAVPAGSVIDVAIDSTRHSTVHYWTPACLPAIREGISLSEAIEQFWRLLRLAVLDRLDGRTAPAMLLSGGVDSASLACVMSQLCTEGKLRAFHTFSLVQADNIQCRETERIRALQRLPGCVPHELEVGQVERSLPSSFYRDMVNRPHPVVCSLSVIALGVEWARASGHDMLLHGVSGDACFETGDTYIRHYLKPFGWRAAWREAKRAADFHPFLRGKSPYALFLHAIASLAPRRVADLYTRRAFSRIARKMASSLTRDFIQRARLREGLRAYVEAMQGHIPLDYRSVRQIVFRPSGFTNGTEAYDRIGARAGITMPDPYSDRRLVDFLMSLPINLVTFEGKTKYLVRKAIENQAFDVAMSKDKLHLGAALLDWQFAQTVRCLNDGEYTIASLKREMGVEPSWPKSVFALDVPDPLVVTHDELWFWVNYDVPLALWLSFVRRRRRMSGTT